MKKVMFLSISAIITTIAFSASGHAQTSTFNKEALAKSVSNVNDADKLALENMRLANQKMYRDFSNRFKNATDIQVSEANNCQLVSCHTDGDYNRVTYTRKGKWQNTLTTYDNSKLPQDIRDQIENAYPRYSIYSGVIEVNAMNKKAYLVLIEDKTSWKRIRVVDGEMDVFEEYQKTK
jgi:hypothetical protein